MATTIQNPDNKPQALVTLWNGETHKGIAMWLDNDVIILAEGEKPNVYDLPLKVVLNPQHTIATIMEDRHFIKPFEVKILKENERYAEHIGRFATAEEAMATIDALSATPVTPYRFQKVVSAY